MSELENILREHAKRYPKMQPTDAVKLIYQNEFGGGHLIRDEQACLNYLRREYASVEKDPATALCEDIGNGIVRVHLAALNERDLDQLGKAFICSAAEHHGNFSSFLSLSMSYFVVYITSTLLLSFSICFEKYMVLCICN